MTMPVIAHGTVPGQTTIERGLLVHEFLTRSATRTPHAVAIIEPSRQITYQELDVQANRCANLLRDRGVVRGDRVVIAMENSIELVVAYLGAMKAGAVAVPLPAAPHSDRLAHAVTDCTPRACIVDAATAADLEAGAALQNIPVRLKHGNARRARLDTGTFEDLHVACEGAGGEDPRIPVIDVDLAAIIYTSGSTGRPRGVMLRHFNIRANTESIVEYLNLTAADRVMCVLPFYYVYGLSLLHTHLSVGGSVVIDNRFTFPNVVLDAMQQHAVTGFAGVPSTFVLLLRRSNLTHMTFPALRYVTQAGGGLAPARITEWLERGPNVPFYVMYGATEASARLTYLAPADLQRKLGSIGRPIPNVEIRVIRDDGEVAGPGNVGELVASGANIALGYWNNPDETRERFDNGSYRTGDLGYADEEGFLFLVGRRHDMIKVGAHRVGTKEIEDVLQEHPDIQEAVVIGVPHEILGEAPVAVIVLREGARADELVVQAFCRERMSLHKVPQRVIFERELPKLEAGKVDTTAIRAKHGQRSLAGTT
jgi:long-chain acyl-CoA synthetase